MTRHIRLRPQVPEDVLDIVRSMLDENPSATERFVEHLHVVLRELAAMPGMGSPKNFRGARLAEIRSWRVKGFPNQLILYRPVTDGIEVLAIVHGARDLGKVLRQRTSE